MILSTTLALCLSAALANALTTAQKAGMRVIYSYPGAAPPQSLLDNISAGLVSGVIFFKENIGTDFLNVISQMNAANAKSPVGLPLLLMTDQEGGQVRRLPGEPVLSAKQMGLSSNPGATSSTAGTDCASNMLSFGMNVNLAPVLDVYRQPGDFEDFFQRSFGNTSTLVDTCGTAFIKAQQAGGVAATAKHFPGLGAATHDQNTDSTPVTLGLTLSIIRSVDEVPYINAIKNGLKLVMPSWAVYKSVDTLPAGLSPFWLKTELRGRLGFTGVTISDAIEAGSLVSFGTDAQRSIIAAAAGMDLILAAGRSASQGRTIVDAMTTALGDGTLNASESDAAVARITSLRQSFA
ncbi:glycoside hydrolase family 3 protein [Collybia nuda]|uniref:Glycoside hydrolase family 3 protein n=1 Tax=Collybia nuda TaxID=64659 RepID=A0A9P5YFZ2_9AGAR|nr:glycoside hydrolase family 3 protein [Collybia nuda]